MAVPTPIRKYGIIKRLLLGIIGFIVFLSLALVIPLWPITGPIFGFMALCTPIYALLILVGEGSCPYCAGKVMVGKKTGGIVCKSCKGRIAINSGQLIPLDAPTVVMPTLVAMSTPGQARESTIPFATTGAGFSPSAKSKIAMGGCGGCLFVVLAFILFGVFLAHQEANRRAALTPEQRQAEDKQIAEEARIAAAQQAAADKKRAEEAKIAAAHQAEVDKQKAAEAKIAADQKAAEDKVAASQRADAVAKPHEQAANKETISYEVLNKRERGDGKFFMDILVSEGSSRQDIKALAESLVRQYDGQYADILIFDSREAQERRLDESYPEKELSRHWLVVIGDALNPEKSREIRWVAEGSAAEARERAQELGKAREELVRLEKQREAAKWHTWTDATGEHHIEAKFGGVTAGNVKLTKRDGTVLTMPLEKLSDEDQEWIKKRPWNHP